MKSTNKSKSTWNIVKTVTNNRNTTNNIASIDINKNFINNPITIANTFKAYFLSVAGNLVKHFSGKHNIAENDPLIYPQHNFSRPNATIRLKNTTTHELDKIIHSLKCKNSCGYD